MFQISGEQFQHLIPESARLGKFGEYSLAFCNPNLRIEDCFGRGSVSVATLDPENVTRQMESPDLTATIEEKLKSPNGTRLDLYTQSAGSASPKISVSRRYLKSLQSVLVNAELGDVCESTLPSMEQLQ
jgi:hypothetical protein